MKPIDKQQRRVANIHTAHYTPWRRRDGSSTGESVLQHNDRPKGVGFHVFKMDPGTTTESHVHTADEEFLVIEGDLVDNDGTVYYPGDLVWLKKGTQHNSYTKTGCILAVYIESAEENL